MINSQKIQRYVIAAALASGLASTAVAASAQTTATPTAPSTTSVSMSTTTDWKAARQAKFDQESADAQHAEFYKLGTTF